MWALIVDNAVHEVTETDPAGRYHPALLWVPCSTDCQQGWVYQDGQCLAPDDYRVLRASAYAAMVEQLDMQYHDVRDGGSRWADHVSSVKAAYPKPGDAA